MLDINLIREQPDLVRRAMRDRQLDDGAVEAILQLDEKRRALLTRVEAMKAERNAVSKEIGQMKDAPARQTKIEGMRQLGDQITALDRQVADIDAELRTLASGIPNLPDARTPVGQDDAENVVLRTMGEPKTFPFTPQPHWDLGPALGIIDFERGTKITGSRFYVLSGAGARLQRALIAYMLDLHIRQGYTEKYLPFMVKTETVFGAGQCRNSPIISTRTTRRTCTSCRPPKSLSPACTWTRSSTKAASPASTPPTPPVSGARR
jgi:seryl-tRNA synthetase